MTPGTICIELTSMLQNIDDNVPNLESVVNMNSPSTDDTVRLAAITRKTAPPLNLERNAVWRNYVGIFFFQMAKMALARKETLWYP